MSLPYISSLCYRHGKATFGYIAFTILAFILDIVFISINESENELYRFAEAMLIICMCLKVYAIYYACQFFGAIGGAAQIDPSILNSSRYSSSSNSHGGMYSSQNNMYNSQNGTGILGQSTGTEGGYYKRDYTSPASSHIFDDNDSSSGSGLLK